jgi:hypothetical protein
MMPKFGEWWRLLEQTTITSAKKCLGTEGIRGTFGCNLKTAWKGAFQ